MMVMCSSILHSRNLHIRAITHTDVGCVRWNNEDSARFMFMEGSKNEFMAVLADGMGGYEHGEEASAIMVNTLCEDQSQKIGKNPRNWLLDMFRKANRNIYALSQDHGSVMGTTCSTLLVWKNKIWCAHMGDSRIYMLSKGKLNQLTCDHTVVGAMLRKGGITKEEALVHPQRNVLTQAIGTSLQIEPDIFRITTPIKRGDRFLLCSDGLYDLVSDTEICNILLQTSLKKAAWSLVDSAKRYGGHDNITVIIVEINVKSNKECDES